MTLRRLAAPLAAAVTVSLLGALGPAVAPSYADEATDAPVTENDRVTVRGGSYKVLDVLANDTDPNGDDLEICRVEVPGRAPISADRVETYTGSDGSDIPPAAPGTGEEPEATIALFVGSARNRSGTYTITYWACDYDYLTPATVTVTVKEVPQVTGAKVPGKPGRVKFRNPGDRRAVVLYGNIREEEPDGEVSLAPTSGKVVRTMRRQLYFVAFVPNTGEVVGQGFVRGISQPRGGGGGGFKVADLDRRELRIWRQAR